MFTGLIEKICLVRDIRRSAESMLLTIDLGQLAAKSKTGDSIAVSGACLTIAGLQGNLASFDVSAETLAKSTLGRSHRTDRSSGFSGMLSACKIRQHKRHIPRIQP